MTDELKLKTEIAEVTGTELTAPDIVAARFLAAAEEAGGSGFGPLLKFVKGHYYVGDIEVPPGHEYVAQMPCVACGWVKFADRKVVDQKIGKIADGFRLPERATLGDLDQSKWEVDSKGPRDPWARQWYLPLLDAESGEFVVFVTGSSGGQRAIGNLCRTYGSNPHRGLPIVRIGVRAYKHKEHGRIEEPEVKIVAWEKAQPSLGVELNDRIPF
jgi:hypothetical protein